MRRLKLRVSRQPSVDILRGRPLVGRSRYRQSERRKFAQPFPQNEDLVVEHQDLRRPADEREALVAPVGAESGTAWAAAKRKPDRYANPLRIALRDIVSGTLDRPLGAS